MKRYICGFEQGKYASSKGLYVCLLRKQSYTEVAAIVDVSPKTIERLVLSKCEQLINVPQRYISTAKVCFPNARIILDRFHVCKLLNQPLDKFRKELRKADKENVHYKKLKWILYKQYHTLSDTQLDDIDAAFAQCKDLQKYYQAGEDFHHILDNSTIVESAI